jgi:hypothetical protein
MTYVRSIWTIRRAHRLQISGFGVLQPLDPGEKMIRFSSRGFALNKLMILVISISVAATGAWNAQTRKADTLLEPSVRPESEGKIKGALEEIKYHLRLAGYRLETDGRPLIIEKGQKSDIVEIRHNGVCYSYFVDNDNNLIRRVESTEKIIAENLNSLRTVRVGQNTVVVTISCDRHHREKEDEIETMSKSYSVIVEMRNLSQAGI